jgi:hypothetical protein
LRRTTGTAAGPVNQSEFLLSSDNGSNFRIENCQYIYNLASGSLGPGSYAVQIGIAGVGVGTAVFALR